MSWPWIVFLVLLGIVVGGGLVYLLIIKNIWEHYTR